MATKQELAEGLTIPQLRELADREGVDLTGLSTKDEIVDAVSSGVGKDALANASNDDEPQTVSDTPSKNTSSKNTSSSTDTSDDASIEDVPLTAEAADLPPLGPPNPEPVALDANAGERISPHDTEALQRAGLSPADLEVPSLGVGGSAIIVKQNPETPSVHQIAGAVGTQTGPVKIDVTLQGADGEEISHTLAPDDHALVSSRAVASNAGHPAHTTPGHYSNPNLTDMTDEEREADQKAYAERFGGVR